MAQCIVCEISVDVERAEKEVYIDTERLASEGLSTSVLVVCTRPRCLRLVREVLADENKAQVQLDGIDGK